MSSYDLAAVIGNGDMEGGDAPLAGTRYVGSERQRWRNERAREALSICRLTTLLRSLNVEIGDGMCFVYVEYMYADATPDAQVPGASRATKRKRERTAFLLPFHGVVVQLDCEANDTFGGGKDGEAD